MWCPAAGPTETAPVGSGTLPGGKPAAPSTRMPAAPSGSLTVGPSTGRRTSDGPYPPGPAGAPVPPGVPAPAPGERPRPSPGPRPASPPGPATPRRPARPSTPGPQPPGPMPAGPCPEAASRSRLAEGSLLPRAARGPVGVSRPAGVAGTDPAAEPGDIEIPPRTGRSSASPAPTTGAGSPVVGEARLRRDTSPGRRIVPPPP